MHYAVKKEKSMKNWIKISNIESIVSISQGLTKKYLKWLFFSKIEKEKCIAQGK